MGFGRMGYGPYDYSHAVVPVALGSGQLYAIPSGQYWVQPGLYTFLQYYDPVTTTWRVLQTPAQSSGVPVSSDGYNWRLANLTGGMMGAVITTAGSGYTNGIYPAGTGLGTLASPTVTMSAGGGSVTATCNVIVGGAINSTITITTAGAGYTHPPILIISPPPAGGVPATAVCTLTGGAVAAVTVTNQGAGYRTAPTVTVVPWPGDTAPTTAAVLTVNATLAQSGAITALTMANNGAGMTSVPTFTFAPASTSAATAIMCFTITTGVAQTNASHMATGNIGLSVSGLTAGSNVTTNPAITTGVFVPRPAYTAFNTTSGGGVTFLDGGLHQIIPVGIAYAVLSDGTISAASTAVAQTVGGAANDVSYLLPL